MKKFRHELKHYINPLDHAELSCKLKALLKPDENAAKGHYLVKSLYFDNYEDKVLREKVNGYLYREKFRLRLYDSNNSFIKLEKKMKLNGLCHKASARITEFHCERTYGHCVFVLVNISRYCNRSRADSPCYHWNSCNRCYFDFFCKQERYRYSVYCCG